MDSNKVTLPQCVLPKQYHRYFYDYGRCLCCKQSLRHEMHAYNHYRKYHWPREYPRYYVWFTDCWVDHWIDGWVEVNAMYYAAALTPLFRRPTAIVKRGHYVK
jgi:hypothetical protein